MKLVISYSDLRITKTSPARSSHYQKERNYITVIG